jgi:hypothetical protein
MDEAVRGRADRQMNLKPALRAFLFVALLLKLLVPAGYMLAPAAAGGLQFAPCAGTEQVRTAVEGEHAGLPHDRAGHEPAKHREAPCPFAALASPVLPPSPPATQAVPVAPAAVPELAPAARMATAALAAPPPPATGPPSSV